MKEEQLQLITKPSNSLSQQRNKKFEVQVDMCNLFHLWWKVKYQTICEPFKHHKILWNIIDNFEWPCLKNE